MDIEACYESYRRTQKPSILRNQGYTIDTAVYPWLAYKGNRSAPRDLTMCLTDIEEAALTFLCGK